MAYYIVPIDTELPQHRRKNYKEEIMENDRIVYLSKYDLERYKFDIKDECILESLYRVHEHKQDLLIPAVTYNDFVFTQAWDEYTNILASVGAKTIVRTDTITETEQEELKAKLKILSFDSGIEYKSLSKIFSILSEEIGYNDSKSYNLDFFNYVVWNLDQDFFRYLVANRIHANQVKIQRRYKFDKSNLIDLNAKIGFKRFFGTSVKFGEASDMSKEKTLLIEFFDNPLLHEEKKDFELRLTLLFEKRLSELKKNKEEFLGKIKALRDDYALDSNQKMHSSIEQVLFFDNFEDEINNNWEFDEDEEDGVCQIHKGYFLVKDSVSYTKYFKSKDFSFECQFELEEKSDDEFLLGLFFRLTEESNSGYRYYICGNNRFKIMKTVNSKDGELVFSTLRNCKLNTIKNSLNTLKVIVDGARISCFLNNIFQMQIEDSDLDIEGSIGFLAMGCTTKIRQVKVTAI